MKSSPLIVNSLDDVGRRLFRIKAKPNDPRNEAWLQELLYSHPDLLPVDEFDDRYSPAIPIGREVPTRRGPIDNLFVSPDGEIIVVETKLWKNPEKHRTVVAQVLDYAKELATWDYNRLNEAVILAARKRGEVQNVSLEDKVKSFLPEARVTPHTFQEHIQENLSGGKFLLLIVGDHISPNIALLTNTIQSAPGLGFTIRLVEMQLFQLSSTDAWPLFVVPRIVGRTVEKPRTVVEVRYRDIGPQVDVINEDYETDVTSSPAKQMDLDVFVSSVPDDLKQPYREAIEQWERIGETVNFSDKRMFFMMELDGICRKVVRCDSTMISVLRRRDVEMWAGRISVFDSYLAQLESAPLALDFARSDKLWIPYSKLSPNDVRVVFRAAISLVQQLKSEE